MGSEQQEEVYSPKRVKLSPPARTTTIPASTKAAEADASPSPSSASSSDASSSDSSSDDDSEDEEGDEPPQPRTDLRARLAAFLPQLKAANETLEAQRREGKLPVLELDDASTEPHIELDLGLGVLEERRPGDTDNNSESEDEQQPDTERDVLGRLMGAERKDGKKGIEEVGDNRRGSP
ncbi:hypothetical protein K461DRAFT_289309 [Myriangium duriaei CBS 260.36]|uniref:Uncharacterized protein n=1 Tax=Myriangium duriaei CBS 260.36 TaxID=1168546 RepID=A0A9P4MJA6_9PEZI|nr:hypothetical protein K461DRAFT_289309 [Myriangium duriaei CBS 260.36]